MTRRRGLNRDPRNSAGAQRAMSMARNASIGSQVGSSLGGHLSSIGKTGTTKGLSISGVLNSIQSGWNSFTNNPANALGDVTGKISQLGEPSDFKVQAGLRNNLDYTDMNPSFRIGINVKNVIDSIPDAGVRGWFNQHTPDETKAVKINHQMYSPTKLMPGDDGWTPTGTGSAKIDSDSLEFLKWAAKNNPTGRTVAEAEKQYERQLNEGMDLYTAMRFNPAETGSIYSLLADPEPTPEPTPEPEPTMDLNKIYNELLGRAPDPAGRDYWGGKFDSGQMSIQNIRDSIKQSTEYKSKLQPPTVQPSPLQMTSRTPPTFSPATVTAASGGGSNTPTLSMTGQQAAPSWNVPSVSLEAIDKASKDFYQTGLPSTSPSFTVNLDPAVTGYRGAAETGYTNTLADFINSRGGAGVGHKDSEWDRTLENIWQQNKLDELTRHAQQSGVGTFTRSEAGTPQWMPEGVDRGTGERTTEDIWQQAQISDLEAWAQTAADKYGLTFKPSDVYSVKGEDGKESRHRNEGMRRNEAQFSGINNLVDIISQIDAARAPEIAAEKDRLSGIYGREIDRLYNELFETDTGMSQEGKDYWTKDLIENRPGLAKGQDWQDWLGRAFRNTHGFKDYEVSKGPELLPIEGAPDDDSGTFPSAAPTFQQDLDVEKGNWGIGNYDSVQSDPWADAMEEFTSSYTSQINDLKKALQESTRSNEKMLKSYQDQVAGYQKDLQAQAAYGERPMNQTVKGVKTRNELPGYKPKTGGTIGHFNRTGSRLSTQSLNVA